MAEYIVYTFGGIILGGFFIGALIAMIHGYDDDTINHETERRKQDFHPKARNPKETFTFFNPARNAPNDPAKELRDYGDQFDK